MRVLHIIHTTNPAYGGPVQSVAELGAYLAGHGIVLEVAASSDTVDAPWLTRYPLKVHPLGPGVGKYGFSRRLVPWLERNGGAYDVWVINGIWQFHAAAAARTARRISKPYLVYTHGMLDPWSRAAHPLKYAKKFVYWVLFEQWTLRGASAVCFTADEELSLARGYFPFGRWKAEVVGAGISPPPQPRPSEVEALRQRFPQLASARVLLHLGRIHPKKGLDLLLRSFAKLAPGAPDLHLLVVGEGDESYVAQMKALATRLGLDAKVTFAGPLYGEAKWSAYALAEIFALPSHQENFGMVVAEALASRVPVLISNRVNIWREVMACKAGLVCDDTQASVDSTLAAWLALDPDERRAYAGRASECFAEHFNVSRAGDNLARLLRRAAGKTG